MNKTSHNFDLFYILFWFFFTLALVSSAWLGFEVVKKAYVNTEIDLTNYINLNRLFSEILLVPLSILAASLPICAVFLALHKSHQTRTQILLAKSHNDVNNFFMHKREFSALCTSLEEKHNISLDTIKLYNLIFENNSPNGVSFSFNRNSPNAKIDNIFKIDRVMKEFYFKASTPTYKPTFEDTVKVIRNTHYAAQSLTIEPNDRNSKVFISEKLCNFPEPFVEDYLLPSTSVKECWNLYYKILFELAFFASSYVHKDPNYIAIYVFDDFINEHQDFSRGQSKMAS